MRKNVSGFSTQTAMKSKGEELDNNQDPLKGVAMDGESEQLQNDQKKHVISCHPFCFLGLSVPLRM